ncbi:unnamed protein product [Chironomus riparius]|uniref:Methyltransferase type 11 domain-containing protein n=1 Tax=Chironomus riparius TaxID=315576 RepID=A0A9N9S659_9DIPT|nr:unnamed protein product [Chironomus riparius]
MDISKKNVDEENIKLLERNSDEWWDASNVLHSMNLLRVPFIIDSLISTGMIKLKDRNKPDVLKGLKILDVGCGAGILSEALAKLKAKVTGLEPAPKLIEVAKDHLQGQSLDIKYLPELIEDFAINNSEKFDAVVASEVVEHVPDKLSLLIGMAKCVKPKGSIIITTPNRSIVSWIATELAVLFKVFPKGTHDWNQFITPSEVSEILRNEDCRTSLVRGIWYTPILDKFNFIPYQGIHYALHAVKEDYKKEK